MVCDHSIMEFPLVDRWRPICKNQKKCWYLASENIFSDVFHPVRNLKYCYRALFVSLKQNHFPGRFYRPLRSVQRYFWDLVWFGTVVFIQFVKVKVLLVFAMRKVLRIYFLRRNLVILFPPIIGHNLGFTPFHKNVFLWVGQRKIFDINI